MPDSNTDKKPRLSRPAVLSIVAIALVALGLVKLQVISNRVDRLENDLASQQRLLDGRIQNNFATEKPVVDPIANVVYLPEFRIKLPFNNVSKSLAYTMRDYGMRTAVTPEADITSTDFMSPQQMTRMDCSVMVRLKLEPKPNPYSPHEKPTSVKLADGRVLQVYESINESECMHNWQFSLSPAMVTAEFQKATSY